MTRVRVCAKCAVHVLPKPNGKCPSCGTAVSEAALADLPSQEDSAVVHCGPMNRRATMVKGGFLRRLFSQKSRVGRTTPDEVFVAAENGRVSEVAAFLQMGGDPNLVRGRYCLLSRAAMNGHGPVVRILLERGAESDRLDPNGFTPLDHAEDSNDSETIRLLREHGACFGVDLMEKPCPNREGRQRAVSQLESALVLTRVKRSDPDKEIQAVANRRLAELHKRRSTERHLAKEESVLRELGSNLSSRFGEGLEWTEAIEHPSRTKQFIEERKRFAARKGAALTQAEQDAISTFKMRVRSADYTMRHNAAHKMEHQIRETSIYDETCLTLCLELLRDRSPREGLRYQNIRDFALGILLMIGDERAVRGLYELAAGDDCRAEEAIGVLGFLLYDCIDKVSDEDLSVVAESPGISQANIKGAWDMPGMLVKDGYRTVDCSFVKEMAKRELRRRGSDKD